MTRPTGDRLGHRPDHSPPPGWKRWKCSACASAYDEETSLQPERRHRCPQCWAGQPHWSVLVERADGATPCPDCQAPILWLTTTASGARIPVDSAPDPVRGNVIVDSRWRAGVLGRTQAAAARAGGRPLYAHHRLTCPHADRWARPRGTRR